jgi:hypothetical protein
MFEREIESIIENTRAKTIGDADSIMVADLLNAPILPSIKIFFHAEVESWLKDEQSHQLGSGRFRHDDLEVIERLKEIDSILVRNAVLSREEFLSILDKAVKLQFNYICRPQWTLAKFIFKNDDVKSGEEIQPGLKYFYNYTYYRDILSRLIQKKSFNEMTLESFERLIRRIDNEVLQSHSSAEIAQLTQPIFDVIREGRPQGENEIDIEALVIFFDDKGRTDISERLTRWREEHQISNMSMERLIALMENVDRSLKSGDESSYTEPPQNVVHTEKTAEEPDAQKEDESKTTSLPVLEGLQAEGFLTFEPSQRAETTEQVTKPPISSSSQQELISSRIRSLLGKRKKKKIIRRIFGGDAAQCEIVLAVLNDVKDWTEASLYVDSMFIKNGVDPYSKSAMTFSEVVQRVFLSQERYLK